MGPMPTGGICIEFHSEPEKALFVLIFNNKKIDIEAKVDDYYYSYEIAPSTLALSLIDNYASISQE